MSVKTRKPKTKKTKTKTQTKKKTQVSKYPPKLFDPAPEQFTIILRGLEMPASSGETFSDADPAAGIAKVLNHKDFKGPQPRFSWQGKSRACVVDVDFHGKYKPETIQLEQVVRRLPLQPLYWWISHGGGLKLVYVATDDLTAEEVGEIAAHLLETALAGTGLTGIEIKADARHPGYPRADEHCSEVYKGGCSDPAATKRKLFYDYPEDDFDALAWENYLAEREWHVGQRLPHTECCINPHLTKDNCIIVNESNLHCFSCHAEGRCLPGMTVAGMMPARYLMDGAPLRTKNNLFLAVKNYVHFEHARWNFKDLPEKRARIRYKAMLKLCHTIDVSEKKDVEFAAQQIFRVFQDFGLIRIQGIMCRMQDGHPDTGIDNRISSMPFCLYKGDRGKAGVDKRLLGHLQSSGDLARFGYRDLTPLRGVDLAAIPRLLSREFNGLADDRLFVVFPANPAPTLRAVVTEEEYRAARELVENRFRGINVDYLLLCIAAKGIHQLSLGMDVARTVATGPTMAGKTRTIQLAAILTGEVAETPQFVKEQDRNKRSYAECSLKSTFVAFDEFAKGAQQMDTGQLLDLLTYFERGAQYHALYHGGDRITLPGAVFLTSPELPAEMLAQPEVCRRWVHIHLTGPVEETDWRKTCQSDFLEDWLTKDPTGEHRAARDTLVSWIVNRYFSDARVWTFKEVAEDMGFKMLSESAENNKPRYIELHRLYREQDYHRGNKHWPEEEQWRVISRVDESDSPQGQLSRMFRELTQDWSEEGIKALRSAVPWAAYLKIPGLRFAVKKCTKDGHNRMGIRFWAAAV